MSTLMSSNSGLPTTNDAMPPSAAWDRLLDWQRDGMQLAFVYSRSLGGLMQTGRGKLTHLGEQALTIEAAGSRLLILLAGASYETGPQLFFTPNLLGRFEVDGVAVRLANHDWLFLSAETMPPHAALSA
ncbi:hypothetical protein [Duganella sp. BJB475]|uniref:hypothetical protein n=1 Tax=Duganella sp. BJB475 TaxID=2233914 RepID=UPI000E34E472|nr:hypothetical protein [Duganella sp. BJB475]RFP11464.1 hypothetical protein D0T23_21365 [Duganella sp. BJB475]